MLQKLTSRKLWVTIIGIATGIMLMIDGEVDKGITLVMTSIVTYIGAESYIDGKSISINNDIEEVIEEESGCDKCQ